MDISRHLINLDATLLIDTQRTESRYPSQQIAKNCSLLKQHYLSNNPALNCGYYMIKPILNILSTLSRSMTSNGRRRLIAENIALRHQLAVLRRNQKRCPNLNHNDRVLFGFLTGLIPKHKLNRTAAILTPSTLLGFHKSLVNKKYKKLYGFNSKGKPGPKGVGKELRQAIIETKTKNPKFGTQRIADQTTLAFGIPVSRDQVRHILLNHYKPTGRSAGPSWLSFIGNAKDSLWSIDFFRCHSVTLKAYYVMLVMDQHTRRIIGFAVRETPPDGIAACNMFQEATKYELKPKYLSSDNDPIFNSYRWRANLRIQEITELKSIPYTPLSHPFVERLIGTIRREFLDQTIFVSKADLERKLELYKNYYNRHRTHQAKQGKPPTYQENTIAKSPGIGENLRWKAFCRGLFHLPYV